MRRTASFAVTVVLAGAAALVPGVAAAQDGNPPALREAASRAAAREPARLVLTIADVVDRAAKASHWIGEFAAREDAARAALSVSSVADMPDFSFLGGYTRTNHVTEFAIQVPGGPPRVIYPDVPDNVRTRLDFLWPVYTGGRTSALERAARSDLNAAGQDLAATRNDTRLDAIQAFWGLVTAKEAVRVVEEALKRMDAHLHDTRTMLQVGLVAPNDVYSAEAQRSREELLLLEARNARDVAEANLHRLTGIPAGTSIDVAASLDEQVPAPADVDSLVAQARAARPERQALAQRVESVAARRDAAAAGLKPIVGVGAGFDYANPNPKIFPREDAWQHSWDVGVNVAWPIWDGGRVKADVAEVSANGRALQERLADLDTRIEFEVRQRRLDLEAAQASIQTAGDAVKSAAEARRVVTDRFEAGVAPATDVLDAQVALLQAELDRTRALANTRLAQARLDRAIGR